MFGSKLKRDVFWNMFFSIIIAVTYMWVIREAGRLLVPVTLGLFLFTRRISDSISNFLQLGTSQTLRRYLPMTNDASTQFMHIIVNIGLFVVVAVVFITILTSNLSFLTRVLFPEDATSLPLTFWLGMFSVASVFGFFASSILLAFGQVVKANFVDLANTSGWLLIIMWWRGSETTVESLFIFQTALMFGLSFVVLILVLFKLNVKRSQPIPWYNYRYFIRETISYGLPRSATPFLEASLFVIGPWLIRHDIKEVGYLIISFTFLRFGRMLVQPAALVIGIAVARLHGQDDQSSLKRGVSFLFGTVLYASIILFSIMTPWVWLVLKIWLGNQVLAQQVHYYTVAIFFAMPSLAIAQALKEPMEMLWKRPFYLINTACSVIILLLWFYITKNFIDPSRSVLFGYVIMYWANCFVSMYWLREYLENVKYYGIAIVCILASIVALTNWLLARMVLSSDIGISLSVAILVGCLSVVVVMGALRFISKAQFVVDVKKQFFA